MLNGKKDALKTIFMKGSFYFEMKIVWKQEGLIIRDVFYSSNDLDVYEIYIQLKLRILI